jgi:hypothetical protein
MVNVIKNIEEIISMKRVKIKIEIEMNYDVQI